MWLSDSKGFILITLSVRAEWTPVSCLSDSKRINAPVAFTDNVVSESQAILRFHAVSTKGGVVQDGQVEKV